MHKRSKNQSSIEYLSSFSLAIVILVIVVGIIAVLFLQGKTSTFTPSTCFISAQLDCQQFAVSSNALQTSAIAVFTNNLGTTMYFAPGNAFTVFPTSSQTYSHGECLPANAPQGSLVVCNAIIQNFAPGAGSQLQPRFQLSYSQCAKSGCPTLNTTGSAVVYVSPTLPLFQVELISEPSTANIVLNGVAYPSGSYVNFIKGITYNIASSYPGASQSTFKWVTSGGASVQSTTSKQTTASAVSSGVIEAVYSVQVTLQENPSAAASSWGACFNTNTDTEYTGYCAGPNLPSNCGLGKNYCSGSESVQIPVPVGAQVNYICTAIWSNPTQFSFQDWSGAYSGSTECPGNLATPITVTSPITINANYNPICYSLTFESSTGGGSESASPSSSGACPYYSYQYGTFVTITATHASGYAFSQWTASGNDAYAGTNNPATITFYGDITENAWYTSTAPSPGCYGTGFLPGSVSINVDGFCVINGQTTNLCAEAGVQNANDCPGWVSGDSPVTLCWLPGSSTNGGAGYEGSLTSGGFCPIGEQDGT